MRVQLSGWTRTYCTGGNTDGDSNRNTCGSTVCTRTCDAFSSHHHHS
jgi:hypothetical protein